MHIPYHVHHVSHFFYHISYIISDHIELCSVEAGVSSESLCSTVGRLREQKLADWRAGSQKRALSSFILCWIYVPYIYIQYIYIYILWIFFLLMCRNTIGTQVRNTLDFAEGELWTHHPPATDQVGSLHVGPTPEAQCFLGHLSLALVPTQVGKRTGGAPQKKVTKRGTEVLAPRISWSNYFWT